MWHRNADDDDGGQFWEWDYWRSITTAALDEGDIAPVQIEVINFFTLTLGRSVGDSEWAGGKSAQF